MANPKTRKCCMCSRRGAITDMRIIDLKAVCLTFDCMDGYRVMAREKERNKQDKAFKTETRRRLVELNRKTIRWQHSTCKTAFNRSRVLEELYWFKSRFLEPECISCGKTNMDWCCGHYKTVGASGNLRYDRKNTFLQCNKYCNESLSGNISGNANTRGYTRGLIDRFGLEEGGEIIEYCETNQSKTNKWTCEQVEGIKMESLMISKAMTGVLRGYE